MCSKFLSSKKISVPMGYFSLRNNHRERERSECTNCEQTESRAVKSCFVCALFIDGLYGKGAARVMIIDLDAHQGNGHARDFMNDGNFLLSLQRAIMSRSKYCISIIVLSTQLHIFNRYLKFTFKANVEVVITDHISGTFLTDLFEFLRWEYGVQTESTSLICTIQTYIRG